MDYRMLYHKIFNTVTDAEKLVTQAATIMQTAQWECEELYLEADDTPIELLQSSEEDKRDES